MHPAQCSEEWYLQIVGDEYAADIKLGVDICIQHAGRCMRLNKSIRHQLSNKKSELMSTDQQIVVGRPITRILSPYLFESDDTSRYSHRRQNRSIPTKLLSQI